MRFAHEALTALVGTVFLTAAVVSQAGVVDRPWGDNCELEWCQPTERAHVDPMDSLEEKAKIAGVEAGMRCWIPSESKEIPLNLVVKEVETANIIVIPFDDEAWARASAGEIEVISACA